MKKHYGQKKSCLSNFDKQLSDFGSYLITTVCRKLQDVKIVWAEFFFESGWYQHMNWWNTNFIPNQYRNSKTQLRLLGNLHRTGLWSNILFMKWISPLFFYLGRATSGNSRTLLRIAESIKKQKADWAEKKSNLRNTFSTIFRL